MYSLQPLNDYWETVNDDIFAQDIFDYIEPLEVQPIKTPSKLCERCKLLDFWAANFYICDCVSELENRSRECQLCSLFYRSSRRYGKRYLEEVRFYRIKSSLALELNGPPVLSLSTLPGKKPPPSHMVRVGFPRLPGCRSFSRFELCQQWIRDCNKNHKCKPLETSKLPRRLVDIYPGSRDINYPFVRLIAETEMLTDRYIVLSHRWGNAGNTSFPSTRTGNIGRFKNKIGLDELPQTFQDAIITTRQLGVRYIWIDSLCIVQDDETDWHSKSQRMGSIYSSAYCTIAATCAASVTSGFLKRTSERAYVTISVPKREPFYVSETIDDFRGDVEESELNRRGWVMQERALSNRTLYFSDSQVYWESGDGVRCETLTKMKNRKAAFIGDPRFPSSALKYFKGGRIQFFQYLYEKYSTLQFTFDSDKPIAIRGLERRLIAAFNTRGDYGTFENYLGRSLLWQRRDISLCRIDFPLHRKVPSWSWMAYKGSIKYMDIPFDTVEWLSGVKIVKASNKIALHEEESSSLLDLSATTMPFELPTEENKSGLIFDQNQDFMDEDLPLLRCAVAGRVKRKGGDNYRPTRYYVILLQPSREQLGAYERVGVGRLPRKCINWDPSLQETVDLV